MSDWGGFRLGDKTALQLNCIMNDGAGVPILPNTRDRTVSIPERNGVLYFGTDLGELRFSIPCAFIFADTIEGLFDHANNLADHLIDQATKKPAKLELVFEADKSRAWDVYYSGVLDLQRTIFDGQFELQLMAPDPTPRSPEDES